MIRNLGFILLILTGLSPLSLADSKHQRQVGHGRWEYAPAPAIKTALYNQHANMIEAISRRKQVHYIQSAGLEIIEVLPEDRDGRRHQKWLARLADGKTIMVVYNRDMCPSVPVRAGDIIAVAGHLVWNKRGPVIHWLHHDPSGRRPPGYVEHRGLRYCEK